MNDRPTASPNTLARANAFFPLPVELTSPQHRETTYTSPAVLSSTTRPTASACHLSIRSAISTVRTPSVAHTCSSSPLFTKIPFTLSDLCIPEARPPTGVIAPERGIGVAAPFSPAKCGGKAGRVARVGESTSLLASAGEALFLLIAAEVNTLAYFEIAAAAA